MTPLGIESNLTRMASDTSAFPLSHGQVVEWAGRTRSRRAAAVFAGALEKVGSIPRVSFGLFSPGIGIQAPKTATIQNCRNSRKPTHPPATLRHIAVQACLQGRNGILQGRHGMAWHIGQAWHCSAGRHIAGQAWHGIAGQEWNIAGNFDCRAGMVLALQAWHVAGQAWAGMVYCRASMAYCRAGMAHCRSVACCSAGMESCRAGMVYCSRHGILQGKHGILQGKHGILWHIAGRHGILQCKHGILQHIAGQTWGMAYCRAGHGILQGTHGRAGMACCWAGGMLRDVTPVAFATTEMPFYWLFQGIGSCDRHLE